MRPPLVNPEPDYSALKYVHISLDPSSTSFGVAVFTTDGKFLTSYCIKVGESVMQSQRLYQMRKKFEDFWNEKFPGVKASFLVVEHLPPSNYAVLQLAAGAIISSGFIWSTMDRTGYISPPSWKYFCKEIGCSMKDPKGRQALTEIGWRYPIPASEDESDAIILYLCARWMQKKVIYLGKDYWIPSFYKPAWEKPGYKPKTKQKRTKK